RESSFQIISVRIPRVSKGNVALPHGRASDTEKERRHCAKRGNIDPRANACALKIQLDRGTKSNLVSSAQRSTGQEDHTEQNMDDVIDFAEHQERAECEHVIGARAQEPTAYSQQQIDNSKDNAESARGAC